MQLLIFTINLVGSGLKHFKNMQEIKQWDFSVN